MPMLERQYKVYCFEAYAMKSVKYSLIDYAPLVFNVRECSVAYGVP